MEETISLDLIDQMYQRAKKMWENLGEIQEQFQVVYPSLESFANPFTACYNQHEIMNKKGEVKKDIESFLVHAYQKAFCPNLSLYNITSNDWFDIDNFSAKAFIEKLHDQIDNPEKMAYDKLWNDARSIIPYSLRRPYIKALMIKNMVSKNVLIAELYTTGKQTRTLDYNAHSMMYAFEKFTYLLLGNYDIFSKQSFLNGEAHTPMANFINRKGYSEIKLPYEFPACGPYIHSTYVYKNGKTLFRFMRQEDCMRVALALAGEEPEFIMQKKEIDWSQLFKSSNTDELYKRVVKRQEVTQ